MHKLMSSLTQDCQVFCHFSNCLNELEGVTPSKFWAPFNSVTYMYLHTRSSQGLQAGCGSRLVKNCTHRGSIFSTIANTRTADASDRGLQSPVHGDARGPEEGGDSRDELRAGVLRSESENPGRILQHRQWEVVRITAGT